MTTGKNRIMIFSPKDDGTYVVEFRTAEGEAEAPANSAVNSQFTTSRGSSLPAAKAQ
jgi:hypothetical protein